MMPKHPMLPLHQVLSRREAIAAFAAAQGVPVPDTLPDTLSPNDGQHLVVGRCILVFAAFTGKPNGNELPNAGSLTLRSATGAAPPVPHYDHHREDWQTYSHIFVPASHADANSWLYCGPAQLGMHSATEACYTFDAAQLPKHVWVANGGAPHWRLTTNGERRDLGPDDLALLHALASAAAEGPGHGHVSLTRWEGDSFEVYFNATRAWPMYLEVPHSSGLYARLDGDFRDCGDEHFSCSGCGIDLQTPFGSTLSKRQGLRLIETHFISGTSPKFGDAIAADPAEADAFPGTWSDDLF